MRGWKALQVGMVPMPSKECPPDPLSSPLPQAYPLPPPQLPPARTYLHTEQPPPTREGTRSESKPRGRTPRRKARHPCRTHCGARAAPSPRATGRTWGHPQHVHSPAACRPRMPPPTSTPGCTRVPTAPCGGPAPLRRRNCVCTPASGRLVRLQKDRPASEGPGTVFVRVGGEPAAAGRYKDACVCPRPLPRSCCEASAQSQVP